ncbi:protein FAR-RED IMPAIRED RESPONSE 1-like [Camellia sinensis]|uniref:protein FAR-RED IMPAIRED RESPONSE 1-like n=1 Tax=Camellia sinensis TaxID=4442 RepID=UPI00103676A3|nr:protein FAR-RED IMPAIRED RESPONSE 1-like [Camellia sinensis]
MEVDSNVGDNPLVNKGEEVEEPNKERATRTLEINDQAGIGVSRNFHSMVVEAGGYESLTFDERDAMNYIERARRLRLGEGDAESIQSYFMRMQAHSERFFYMIDVDEEFHIRNLFWAKARSQTTYEAFGDVVSFDTTYLTNKYNMPFAPFVGVNHHGQSILLGCGLLSSEDTNTFVWLFKSWLSCMSNHPPKKLKGYAQYEAIKLVMQNAVYDCLTRVEFESKWEEMLATFKLYDNEWLGVLYDERHQWQAYTNTKFKKVQGELKILVYCQPLFLKEKGSISTYNVQDAIMVCKKMKHVDFVVYFNSTECEVQCMCRLFEYRGIMCAHSLTVLVRRYINEVPSKYIMPRWRKDLDREYAYIKTTYTGFGNDFNASCYERMNKKLIAIVQLVGNSEGKTNIIDLGLDEIKERVMKEESNDESNLPCSRKSTIRAGSTQGATSRKVISPLVARRRGRPVTKRKVAKVDQIVNRFKAAKLLRFGAQAQAKAKATAYTLYYPYMVGMQNSMYVLVANGIRGTSLTPSNFISGTPGSLMSAPT